jgi:hypothetical protein
MTFYSIKDLILVENYNNYNNYNENNIVILEKIDIFKIYNNINFFQNINYLKLSEINEYFPLFKLFNIDYNKWKNYKYEFTITNLLPTDLNVDIGTVEFIQNNFIKYILNQWDKINNINSRILLLLTLLDFLSKTISISHKNLMNTLINKLKPHKYDILNLGLINENILNDLLKIK